MLPLVYNWDPNYWWWCKIFVPCAIHLYVYTQWPTLLIQPMYHTPLCIILVTHPIVLSYVLYPSMYYSSTLVLMRNTRTTYKTISHTSSSKVLLPQLMLVLLLTQIKSDPKFTSSFNADNGTIGIQLRSKLLMILENLYPLAGRGYCERANSSIWERVLGTR